MWSLKHNRREVQPPTERIVSKWNKQGVALLSGSSGIFFLSHIWQFELILRGFSIHTVDCAIRFDAYAIAEEALRHGISPEDIHDKITVSRCFTPYQILDEMRFILNTHRENSQSSGNSKITPVYFILAPAKQFFDGDVAADEGEGLLKKLSWVFEEFQRRSIPLMIVEKDSYSNPSFKGFIKHTSKIANPLFQLQYKEKKFEQTIRKLYSVRIAGLIKEAG